MKRIIQSSLVLLLVGVLLLSLLACEVDLLGPLDSDPNPDQNDSSNENEQNGKEPPKEEDPTPIFSYDLERYSIVYPSVADSATSAATSLLRQMLQTKGLKLDAKKDTYMGESTEEAYEIVVGNTNRAGSSEALKRIETEKGYVIEFFENQIAIQSNVDQALEDAVRYFVEAYVGEGPNYVLDVKEGDWYAAVQRNLAQSGEFSYHLVLGSEASTAVKDAAKSLQGKLQSTTGVSVKIGTDSDYQEEATNIVIGTTAYPESTRVRESLQINQYGIYIQGNKIVLNAHHDKTIVMAIQAFAEAVESKAVVSKGTTMLYVPVNGCYDYSAWLGDIPEFTRGTYDGVYECGQDNLQVLYREVQEMFLDEYVQSICTYGYEVKEDNTIGENRSVTLVGEQGLVHLNYLNYNHSLSIITDPLTQTVYKDGEPTYQKVTENTLAVSTLLYTHREPTDGNGMGYVVTLEDGRYIIFDGGYADQKTGESQADVLYEFLEENYKGRERKIEIAAWVFSHSHGDHYGAFQSFTSKYADRVKVEYFIYNAPSQSVYTSFDGFLEKTLPTYIPKSYPDAKIIKPHTGQILKFCNVEFEVLYAQESFAPGKIALLNDASLILRMNVNGQKVLFTGDAEASASNLLCEMYGSYLKSDILQINHHGYSGGTVELYNLVDPTYTVWPTSQAAFDLRTTGTKYQWISAAAVISNKHVYDKVGRSNCFVADGPVEIIHFPLNDKTLDIEYYHHST